MFDYVVSFPGHPEWTCESFDSCLTAQRAAKGQAENRPGVVVRARNVETGAFVDFLNDDGRLCRRTYKV